MPDILSLLSSSPESTFIESSGVPISRKQAGRKILRTVDALSASKAKTVAIFADNQADWIFVDLACQIMGICCIPLPLFFSQEQIQHSIDAANVDIIVTDQVTRVLRLSTAIKDKAITINNLHVYSIKQNIPSEKPEETEKITFTSGSTGTPKGVCLTSEQQWGVAHSIADIVNKEKIRHLCILPLSTLLENIVGVYASMLVGGTIITPSLSEPGFNGSASFRIDRLLHTIERSQPNTLILLPQLLLGLVNAVESGWKPPASIETIAVGGGKVAVHLIERARRCRLPVYEGYGLSECGSVVSLNTANNDKPGSVGKPLPHHKVEIRNNEIHVKGQAFLGYLNEPESWYQPSIDTGDLGYLDEDGYLFIDGRKKNVLVSSYGRNINPEWVESELSSHPMIQQCVVFGDAKPFCCAIIFSGKADIDDSNIQAWVDKTNRRLPDYARIRTWLRLEKPLTPDNGLLTDNGRPRRSHISRHYQAEIKQMYNTMEKYA